MSDGSAGVAGSVPILGSDRMAEMFRLSPNPYVVLDRALVIVETNEAYLAVTMRRRADLVGRGIFDAFPSDPDSASHRQLAGSLARCLREARVDHIPLIRYDIPNPNGGVDERFWSATHSPLLDDRGDVAFILQHTVDVTELQRLRAFAEGVAGAAGEPRAQVESDVLRRAQAVAETNRALQEDQRRLLSLFQQAPGFMAVMAGPDHVFELANDSYLALVGNRRILGLSVREALPEIRGQGFYELLDRVYTTRTSYVGRGVRAVLTSENGEPVEHFLDFVYQPVLDGAGKAVGIFVQGHDMTDQRRAEMALQALNADLEAQVAERTRELQQRDDALRQSQKMEVVGQLTGGVAHDFNNLLQIVIGNLETIQRHAGPDSGRLLRAANNAMSGARRAATLTQRLLAFSRRQPLDPKPFNPNRLLAEMSDMLHRTLGEPIEIQTILAAGLWMVEADPNQLESAILNLAVNARDAMPAGGQLTIETANTRIDDAYSMKHVEVRPGHYVVVCVSDTGSGMSREVREKAFEPFFTTKEPGKGTGLGLSMVYGFVKQSGGHVKIYSEPGHGTTVKIYLPRHTGPGVDVEPDLGAPIPEGARDETILVLEDDDDVRSYSSETLRDLGYRVLEAHDGPSALRILERRERVDLLFTDVILPGGMTGADVAEAARMLVPGLKVLFTTGYARDAIVHHGRLDPGVELIGKPFALADLATKVRQVLDGM